jgi:hypothetical protein
VEERTREIVASRLGVRVVERGDEAYRTALATGLDGEWLGGFVQPGVVLRDATAMRFTLAGCSGRSVDEYGQASLTLLELEGERVELTKVYSRSSGTFRYVGRLSNGTLSGYWYSATRPAFCGVFWFARTERLADETGRALERGIKTWSARRGLLIAGMLLLTVMTVSLSPRVVIAALCVWAGGYAIYRSRARALSAEVASWRSLLG